MGSDMFVSHIGGQFSVSLAGFLGRVSAFLFPREPPLLPCQLPRSLSSYCNSTAGYCGLSWSQRRESVIAATFWDLAGTA